MPNNKYPQKTLTFYQIGIKTAIQPNGDHLVTFDVRDWDDQISGTFTFTIPAKLHPARAIMISNVTSRFLQTPTPTEY